MKRILTLLVCTVSLNAVGQVYGCLDPGSCNYNPYATESDGSCLGVNCDDPWLELEVVTVHQEGELAGMTTFRLYLNTPGENDFLASLYGDVECPLVLSSSAEPAWFQHELPESAFAESVNPELFDNYPNLEFDSWLTIGGADNTMNSDIIFLEASDCNVFAEFEDGDSIFCESEEGVVWFHLPIQSNLDGFSGPDKRVLVAQLTTAGTISGQIGTQVFPDFDHTNEFRGCLPIINPYHDQECIDENDNGMCDYYELAGCTDQQALNYIENATESDDSCIYSSSDLWVACGNGTVWDEASQTCIIDETYCSWQPDSDGDQLIGVSDLLMFLSVFGDTDLDQDGIFDSNDDCVGEYDECGVCNGSGPSIPIVESVEILYDSLYAEQIDEWWVFEVGVDTTYSLICGYGCTDEAAENYDPYADTDDGSCLYPWACGDPLEYQGYDYETVQIGEQCWFAENLSADTYLNGDSILFVSDAEDWVVESGAMTRQPDNLSTDLGALYNWLAVDDSRGLCPSGWHVSTDSDWQLLNLQAGLPMDELDSIGWLGGAQDIGNKLKDPNYWNGGQGYDLFGFGARAGGYMNSGGTGAVGANGDWWTRDVPPPNMHPIRRGLHANEEGNMRCRCSGWNDGFSIRCVKDTE